MPLKFKTLSFNCNELKPILFSGCFYFFFSTSLSVTASWPLVLVFFSSSHHYGHVVVLIALPAIDLIDTLLKVKYKYLSGFIVL